jgi:hypothetical protein
VPWLGYRVKDVAKALDKAPGTVSRWLADGVEPQRSEPTFRRQLDRLAAMLLRDGDS